jgi:hypothetical protein
MQILELTDPKFKKYGRVVKNVDFAPLVEAMQSTPLPEGVAYEPSVEVLEATSAMVEIQTKCYGELPIQIGYCNGHNVMLNAVEYHRSSELNVAATDAVLMLGCQQDITDDFTYDTSLMEAFKLPKGVAVELYATTLHYAPCSYNNEGFKVAIVLPKNTNLPLEKEHDGWEDKLITAKNKWLIGHAEGGLDAGAHIGLVGKNLNLNE